MTRSVYRPQCCERAKNGIVAWVEHVSDVDGKGWHLYVALKVTEAPQWDCMTNFTHCLYCGSKLPDNPYGAIIVTMERRLDETDLNNMETALERGNMHPEDMRRLIAEVRHRSGKVEAQKHEHECFTPDDNERIQACGCTDVKRTDEKTVVVMFANGGHIRITSETPVRAFCQPEERD